MAIYIGGKNITGGFTTEEKNYFNNSIDSINEQLDTNVRELTSKINEVASTGTTTEIIQNKVSEMAQNGTITFNTVSPEMTTFFNISKSKNMFNGVIHNGYVSYDGTVSATEGFKYTDKIKVNVGDTIYTSKEENGVRVAVRMRFITLYDKNGNVVNGSNEKLNSFTIPQGVDSIIISSEWNNMVSTAKLQIEASTTGTFTDYEEYFSPIVKLENQYIDDELLNNINEINNNINEINNKIEFLDNINCDASGLYDTNIEVSITNKEGTGFINYCSHATKIIGKFKVKILQGSVGRTVRQFVEDRGTCAYVDFGANSIGFAKSLAGYSINDTLVKESETKIPFTLVANREYQIEDIVIEDKQILTVRDCLSCENYTISRTLEGYGKKMGILNAIQIGSSDKIERINRRAFILQPKEPKVAIIGDSFIEGYYPYRYATLIKRELKGNVYIDGYSGCKTEHVLERLNDYIKIYIKPKYVILACGTNDTDYSVYLSKMQECIRVVQEEMKAIPILVTVTFRGDIDNSSFVNQVNSWIKSSGYKFVDFNIITSLNYEGTAQDTTKFLIDGVHPTTETFKEMYIKTHIDIPEIYNS